MSIHNTIMISDSPSLNDTFEHAEKIAMLAERFSLTKFKDFQKKAGRDTIVVQPTGGGRSLCYQFPPVFDNKNTSVVSPTISLELVIDQVTEKEITSVFLGSAQIAEDRTLSPDGAEFITPEWLVKRETWEKVKALECQNKLSVIAINEVNLYYQWQEFCSAYKDL